MILLRRSVEQISNFLSRSKSTYLNMREICGQKLEKRALQQEIVYLVRAHYFLSKGCLSHEL